MNRKKTFEQDGFVAVPGFCDAGGLRTIEAELSRFIAERVPALPVDTRLWCYTFIGQLGIPALPVV